MLVAADPDAWTCGAEQAASANKIIVNVKILFIISFLSVVSDFGIFIRMRNKLNAYGWLIYFIFKINDGLNKEFVPVNRKSVFHRKSDHTYDHFSPGVLFFIIPESFRSLP